MGVVAVPVHQARAATAASATGKVGRRARPLDRLPRAAAILACLTALTGCPEAPPEVDIVERGRVLFFKETFDGNGRTCGTCHRAEDNLGLTPTFIATLPLDDPLFVAETNPALARSFENPRLMRSLGLILENLDGFHDLDNDFTMRGVPHTLALRTSVDSRDGPRTGWSGDGSPGDGSLRSFAVGAVIQHFPRTTNRVAGVDFRLPTDEELDAIEAFLLAQGRQEDLELPLPLRSAVTARGQEIFLDDTLGKCNACHLNAGANADPAIFGAGAGNLSFDTGVEDLPDHPADLLGEPNPPDDGFGTPGNGEFNTPPLVEAADTGPFFHDNSVSTIEGAVAFYNGASFNDSPAGQLLIAATGSGIELEATQVAQVAAFLRAINALENIRASEAILRQAREQDHLTRRERLPIAVEELDDAIMVLTGADLHGQAVTYLRSARAATEGLTGRFSSRLVEDALRALASAQGEIIEQGV